MIDPRQPDYCSTPVAVNRPHFSYFRSDQEGSCALGIITFCYNAGPLFEETIDCILHQSFQNFEWIIVDDGSTDVAFIKRLARLESEDSRIRVIRQENQGPAAAGNRAVREARADYIFQIDGGDLVEPTFAEKCLWALVSNPQYSFCNSYAVGFGDRTYLWPMGFERSAEFPQENRVSPYAVIRRAAHLGASGYDETIRHGHEDWDWFNVADKGHGGYTIPEYLVWYRWRANSHTRETTSDPARHRAFRALFNRRYPNLLNGPFTHPQPQDPSPFEAVCDELPFPNPIGKPPGQKRLLMLLPWLAMGGADKFNLDVVEQLTRLGYEITICTTLDGPSPWYHEFARFTPDIFILRHFLRLVDYPRFLRYLIESRQVDVVLISHSSLGYQLLPYLRSRCPGVTFVDYNHMEEEYWKNGGHPRSGVDYQELLDLNIVSSRHLKDWMVARGADGSRIEVCYTNIDPGRWDPAQYSRSEICQSLGVSETVPLILYAGRLCDQKRPRLFAKVMLELARQKLEFLCLVAGDGEARRFLETFIQRHKLSQRVRLMGAVSNERMRELVAAADIFFLPSKWEGIALTLFEAMSMQVVPIAADVGGQRELVTPECGFLIPQGRNELQEYVSVLKQLIESPELRTSMGQAGRRRIMEHFTIDRMAERMVKLLNRAQELSRTSPRPAVGKGLGMECASLAIEHTRVEKLANELWATHYVPALVTRLLRSMDIPAVQRVYWKLSALRGFKQLKTFAVRLLSVNR